MPRGKIWTCNLDSGPGWNSDEHVLTPGLVFCVVKKNTGIVKHLAVNDRLFIT